MCIMEKPVHLGLLAKIKDMLKMNSTNIKDFARSHFSLHYKG